MIGVWLPRLRSPDTNAGWSPANEVQNAITCELLAVHAADDVVDRLVALLERLLRDDLAAELLEAVREALADVLEVAEQVVGDDHRRMPAAAVSRTRRRPSRPPAPALPNVNASWPGEPKRDGPISSVPMHGATVSSFACRNASIAGVA